MFISGILLIFYGGLFLLFSIGLFLFVGIALIVVAIITILGGINAYNGNHFRIALIGAVCALAASCLFIWPLLLSLPALVFIVLRRNTFTGRATPIQLGVPFE